MSKVIYRSRAPLRLGLAGGGTDVSPFSEEYGGSILNATIDLYAQAILEPTSDEKIYFSATDLDQTVEVESKSFIPTDCALRLHCAIYNRIVKDYTGGKPLSFHLTTYSDVPSGSGLGSSSTMVVCILQAFSEWLNLGLGEYELAHLAFEIERLDLGLSGGKQDQYAASFGGFNFIEFGANDKVLVNPLRIKSWIISELESSMILFYTGQSRESALIIDEQIKSSIIGTSKYLDAMFQLKKDSIQMKEAILKGDLQSYGEILGRSWVAKKSLSNSVSNAGIDLILSDAISAGAIAGKISGAGGGGFLMLYVPPKLRNRVLDKLAGHRGQVMNFHFVSLGVHGWTI